MHAYVSFHCPLQSAIKHWFMKTGHEDTLGHKDNIFIGKKKLPLKLAIIVLSKYNLVNTRGNLIRRLQ